jgi:hypothetical protein
MSKNVKPETPWHKALQLFARRLHGYGTGFEHLHA